MSDRGKPRVMVYESAVFKRGLSTLGVTVPARIAQLMNLEASAVVDVEWDEADPDVFRVRPVGRIRSEGAQTRRIR